jgi:stearoyl-CoA desaturase (delta-9 desaturase)
MPPQRGSSGSTSITELPSPRAGDSNVKPLLIPGADSAYVPSSVPKYVVPQPGESYEGLLGDLPAEWRGKPLWSQLNWLHTPLLLFTPLVAAYGVWHWAFDWRTLLFAVAYYFFSGLGITAGAFSRARNKAPPPPYPPPP